MSTKIETALNIEVLSDFDRAAPLHKFYSEKVSIVLNVRAVPPLEGEPETRPVNKVISLSELKGLIENAKDISHLHTPKDPEAKGKQPETPYQRAKKKLAAFLPSGQCYIGHSDKTLSNYNGIIQCDIDNLGSREAALQLYEQIKSNPFCLLTWISPSGKGVKQLVKTDSQPERHKEAFAAVEAYFNGHYGLALDDSCNKLSLPCFIAYSPCVSQNDNPELFHVPIVETPPTPEPKKKETPPTPAPMGYPTDHYNQTGLEHFLGLLEGEGYDIDRKGERIKATYPGGQHGSIDFAPKGRGGVYIAYCHSSNVDWLPKSDKGYTLAQAFSHHQGLEQAGPGLNRALAELGFKDAAKEPKAPQVIAEPEPEKIKDFPIEVFPPKIRQSLVERIDKYGYDIDYICGAALHVLSAIPRLQITGRFDNFDIYGNLFIALVGEKSTNKSQPFTEMKRALLDIDAESYAEYKAKFNEYLADQGNEKKAKNSQKAHKKAKPICKQILTSDTTIEKVTEIMQANEGAICLSNDELAFWLATFARYSKADTETPFYLSAWGNETVRRDRVGSEPVLIPKSYCSVGGTIQPAILKDLRAGNKSQNGFFERFLFVYPDNPKTVSWGDKKEANKDILHYWHKSIKALILWAKREKLVYELTPEAREITFAWHYGHDSAKLKDDSFAKYDRYMLRFALLLQMLSDVENENYEEAAITAETIKKAIKVYDYFKATMQKCSGKTLISAYEECTQAQQRFLDVLPETFTTQEAIKAASKELSERTVKHHLAKLSGLKGALQKVKSGFYKKIY